MARGRMVAPVCCFVQKTPSWLPTKQRCSRLCRVSKLARSAGSRDPKLPRLIWHVVSGRIQPPKRRMSSMKNGVQRMPTLIFLTQMRAMVTV